MKQGVFHSIIVISNNFVFTLRILHHSVTYDATGAWHLAHSAAKNHRLEIYWALRVIADYRNVKLSSATSIGTALLSADC